MNEMQEMTLEQWCARLPKSHRVNKELDALRAQVITPEFDGETYTSELDKPRLTSQLVAVKTLIQEGEWWTLEKLAAKVSVMVGRKATEASVSARLRDCRKKKFGGLDIEHERVGNSGLWRYRLRKKFR